LIARLSAGAKCDVIYSKYNSIKSQIKTLETIINEMIFKRHI